MKTLTINDFQPGDEIERISVDPTKYKSEAESKAAEAILLNAKGLVIEVDIRHGELEVSLESGKRERVFPWEVKKI